MNVPFFIARRYFLPRQNWNFINLISLLSMAGVCIATAALIIVLSIFNGLEDLQRSLYSSFDPEFKIEAAKGKSFEASSDLLEKVKSVPGVEIVTEVIEDYAYVRYREADMVVSIKGLSDNFIDQHRLDDHIDDGTLKLHDKGIDYAIVGRGVRNTLSVELEDEFNLLQIYYIKNLKPGGLADPSSMYAHKGVRPGAIFSIEKNYDENYIFLPLNFVRDLLDYGNRRTSLDVKTDPRVDPSRIQDELKEKLGDTFLVLSNDEQHKDLYRLLKMEKLFIFLSLTLLTAIVSINIFFSLMMLALDKKKDISILTALGAGQQFIRRIFFTEGALISLIGVVSGLLLGGTLCWMQDRFGLVGMGMENAVVANYPVQMRPMDFVYTSAVITAITLLISVYPSTRAAKFYAPDQL